MKYSTERFIKKCLWFAVIAEAVFLWFYPEYIKRLIYPVLYGQPTNKALSISADDVFIPLTNNENQEIERIYDNEKVSFIPQVKYSVTAKIGIMERYDGWWENYYHRHRHFRMLYNKFSPLDLSLFYGENATKKMLEKCELRHEYRGLFSCNEMDRGKLNNYHIIPANNNVAKGMQTLMNGDVVYIEGILVNVKHPYSNKEMKTGTAHNMIHDDQFMGGQYSGMCFITYTTKLIVNGYIYQ